MNTEFWLNDPTILLKQSEISKFWPSQSMSSEEKMNAITRLIIVLTLVGSLFTKNLNILLLGLISLVVIILYYFYYKKINVKEELDNLNNKETGVYPELTNPIVYSLMKDNYEKPKPNNPLSNLLLPEIYFDPKRKPAPPSFNSQVEEQINSIVQTNVAKKFEDPDIKNKLFANLGDALEFNRAMNRFTATANQQVPNDRDDFVEYCYGEMISGKEGNPLALERQQSGAVNYRNI